jgi:NAD-dependent SIR2 family protein deacetylase
MDWKHESGEPSQEQKEILIANREQAILEAAQALKQADIFLLSVGAGFSADSGLAVYNDVAKFPAYERERVTYPRLCNPNMLIRRPELFYGFMGKCFNDYRQTPPHQGYQIIRNWKNTWFSPDQSKPDDYFPNEFLQEYQNQIISGDSIPNSCPGPFYVYSSNVDGHFLTAGFDRAEVYEIHGSMEDWQCEDCDSKPFTWSAPKDYEFIIDPESMTAPDILNPWIPEPEELETKTMAFTSNWPKCISCGGSSRPCILMFGDMNWHPATKSSFYSWERIASSFCNKGKSLVNLEIGCGNNVSTVRCNSENFLRRKPSSKLIRINPDFPLGPEDLQSQTISIMGKGLETLLAIQNAMDSL